MQHHVKLCWICCNCWKLYWFFEIFEKQLQSIKSTVLGPRLCNLIAFVCIVHVVCANLRNTSCSSFGQWTCMFSIFLIEASRIMYGFIASIAWKRPVVILGIISPSRDFSDSVAATLFVISYDVLIKVFIDAGLLDLLPSLVNLVAPPVLGIVFGWLLLGAVSWGPTYWLNLCAPSWESSFDHSMITLSWKTPGKSSSWEPSFNGLLGTKFP